MDSEKIMKQLSSFQLERRYKTYNIVLQISQIVERLGAHWNVDVNKINTTI